MEYEVNVLEWRNFSDHERFRASAKKAGSEVHGHFEYNNETTLGQRLEKCQEAMVSTRTALKKFDGERNLERAEALKALGEQKEIQGFKEALEKDDQEMKILNRPLGYHTWSETKKRNYDTSEKKKEKQEQKNMNWAGSTYKDPGHKEAVLDFIKHLGEQKAKAELHRDANNAKTDEDLKAVMQKMKDIRKPDETSSSSPSKVAKVDQMPYRKLKCDCDRYSKCECGAN